MLSTELAMEIDLPKCTGLLFQYSQSFTPLPAFLPLSGRCRWYASHAVEHEQLHTLRPPKHLQASQAVLLCFMHIKSTKAFGFVWKSGTQNSSGWFFPAEMPWSRGTRFSPFSDTPSRTDIWIADYQSVKLFRPHYQSPTVLPAEVCAATMTCLCAQHQSPSFTLKFWVADDC